MPKIEGRGKKKSGKGTHGSTTKAGKVRLNTPKIPVSNFRKKYIPRIAKRKLYRNREILKRNIGQVYIA